jgi:uncharacterized protein YeaO (DUF488 family)
MLFTKSILKPRAPEDGVRISVMSRHTLQDGRTPDERITSASYDEHNPLLAPPATLVGAYYREEVDWMGYELRYHTHLQRPGISDAVKQLAARALQQDITLLCIEETAEHCHRRLLAEECKRYQPKLDITHR